MKHIAFTKTAILSMIILSTALSAQARGHHKHRRLMRNIQQSSTLETSGGRGGLTVRPQQDGSNVISGLPDQTSETSTPQSLPEQAMGIAVGEPMVVTTADVALPEIKGDGSELGQKVLETVKASLPADALYSLDEYAPQESVSMPELPAEVPMTALNGQVGDAAQSIVDRIAQDYTPDLSAATSVMMSDAGPQIVQKFQDLASQLMDAQDVQIETVDQGDFDPQAVKDQIASIKGQLDSAQGDFEDAISSSDVAQMYAPDQDLGQEIEAEADGGKEQCHKMFSDIAKQLMNSIPVMSTP